VSQKGYGTENTKPIQSAKKWFGSPVVLKAVTKNGLVLMKRSTTFAAFAVFAFLAGSSTSIPEQSNSTGPVLLNAPRGQAPVPVIKPIHENRISRQIRSAPAPGDGGAGQDASHQRSRTTDRPPLIGVEDVPSSGPQQVRRRAVYREPARRINIAGGVLVLPAVVYYGVPVILNVPELGYVDVPEDEYARLYDKLSSSDSEQVQEAMSSLRKLKELEEAEVEALQRAPERLDPYDTQDLSEPIFFGSPSRAETRRRGLY
jgi:hypothetical protein